MYVFIIHSFNMNSPIIRSLNAIYIRNIVHSIYQWINDNLELKWVTYRLLGEYFFFWSKSPIFAKSHSCKKRIKSVFVQTILVIWWKCNHTSTDLVKLSTLYFCWKNVVNRFWNYLSLAFVFLLCCKFWRYTRRGW